MNNDRIFYEEKDGLLTIMVTSTITKAKMNLLFIWLMLWTLCGIIVFSQFFAAHSREMKLMMLVWFAFWSYFEYKIGYAYLWRKTGKEIIRIIDGKLFLKRDIGGSGKEDSYLTGNITKLKTIDFNSKQFTQTMNNSFWVIGGETVFFEYMGKTIGCGLQLSEPEAIVLFKKLKQGIKDSLKQS